MWPSTSIVFIDYVEQVFWAHKVLTVHNHCRDSSIWQNILFYFLFSFQKLGRHVAKLPMLQYHAYIVVEDAKVVSKTYHPPQKVKVIMREQSAFCIVSHCSIICGCCVVYNDTGYSGSVQAEYDTQHRVWHSVQWQCTSWVWHSAQSMTLSTVAVYK